MIKNKKGKASKSFAKEFFRAMIPDSVRHETQGVTMQYWPFFLLPFAIFAGTAGQYIGVFSWGLFLPLWYYRKNFLAYGAKIPLGLFSISLLGIYLIFPLFDVLLTLWYRDPKAQAITAREWIHGPVSTSIGVLGLMFAIFQYRKKKHLSLHMALQSQGQETSTRVFNQFNRGLLLASAILLGYVLLQFFTGYDYRPHLAYRADRILGAAFHRPFGFYSHPLSLASVSLALACFYWQVFWVGLEQRGPELNLSVRTLFAIASMHAVIVFLSASRMASLVLLAFLLWIPLTRTLKKGHRVRKWLVLPTLVLSVFFYLRFGTDFTRWFQLQFDSLRSGGDHRMEFWQVHWQIFMDQPFWGHGHLRLESFLREDFYRDLGLATLPQRYNAHNIFLEVLVDIGIFGTFLLLMLLKAFFSGLSRVSEREIVGALLYRGFVYSFAANLAHGLTQNTFFDAHLSFCYLALFLVLMWSLIDHSEYQIPEFRYEDGLYSPVGHSPRAQSPN